MISPSKIFSSFAILTALAAPVATQALGQEAGNRLLIVSANSGRVVYDDGRDDLFCVTRRHFIGYDVYGRRHFRRAMHCR